MARALGFTALFGLLATQILSPAQSFATTLDEAAFKLPNTINTFMAGADGRSSDKNPPNYLKAFSGVVGGDFYAFDSFNGPVSLSGQLTLEVAAFANGNDFGVITESPNAGVRNASFNTLIDGSAVPGKTFTEDLGTGTFDFAFRSKENNVFSSIAAENFDGILHIIGQQVVNTGTVFLNGLSFNVLSGDYVLYMEDLPKGRSDLDYNDAVVIVRAHGGTAVPEPASMLLLSSGLIAAAAKRRSKKA